MPDHLIENTGNVGLLTRPERVSDPEALREEVNSLLREDHERIDTVAEVILNDPYAFDLLKQAYELRDYLASPDNGSDAAGQELAAKFTTSFDAVDGQGMDHTTLQFILEKAYPAPVRIASPEPSATIDDMRISDDRTEAPTVEQAPSEPSVVEKQPDEIIYSSDADQPGKGTESKPIEMFPMVSPHYEILDIHSDEHPAHARKFHWHAGNVLYEKQPRPKKQPKQLSAEPEVFVIEPKAETSPIVEPEPITLSEGAPNAVPDFVPPFQEAQPNPQDTEPQHAGQPEEGEQTQTEPEIAKERRNIFKKAAGSLVDTFHYVAARWSVTEDLIMSRGTNSSMSEVENDALRNRNRRSYHIVKGLGLTLAAGTISYVLHHTVDGSSLFGGVTPQGGGESFAGSTSLPMDVDQLFPNDGPDQAVNVETAPLVTELQAQSPEVANIPLIELASGQGGYDVLDSLQLPHSVWDDNQTEIYEKFGPVDIGGSGELYGEPGNLGFNYAGKISEELQNLIISKS